MFRLADEGWGDVEAGGNGRRGFAFFKGSTDGGVVWREGHTVKDVMAGGGVAGFLPLAIDEADCRCGILEFSLSMTKHHVI